MGFNIRHADEDDLAIEHAINVTPFIDVMLVLLIIFMVAAPLATVEMNVDLPSSQAAPQDRPDEPVYLTVRADRSLMIGERSVSRASLAAALDAASEGDKETRIFLRADKSVDYETLMQTMDGLREAGYLKVALVALEDAR